MDAQRRSGSRPTRQVFSSVGSAASLLEEADDSFLYSQNDPIEIVITTPETRSISWVMAPSYGEARRLNDRLFPQLSMTPIVVDDIVIHEYSISDMGRGQKEYTMRIEGPAVSLDSLEEEISRLSSRPLTFPIPLNTPSPSVYGALGIVKGLLSRDFHINPDTVVAMTNKYAIELHPYTKVSASTIDKAAYDTAVDLTQYHAPTATLALSMPPSDNELLTRPVYVTKAEYDDILSEVDPNRYLGYELLSANRLVWVALNQPPLNSNKYLLHDVVERDGMALYPIQETILEIDPILRPFFLSVEDAVNQLIDQGAFHICTTAQNLQDLELIRELALSFGFQILSPLPREGIKRCLFLQPPPGQNLLTASWIQTTINHLLAYPSREVPTVLITGNWSLEVEPTIESRLRLQYSLYRAIVEVSLGGGSPELLRVIGHARALPDLSVQLPVFSAEDIPLLEERINAIFSGPFYYIPCEDFADGVLQRWSYQNAYPHAGWLIVRLGQKEYLGGTIDNVSSTVPQNEADLISALQDYFSKACIIGERKANRLTDLRQLLDIIVADGDCISRNEYPSEYGWSDWTEERLSYSDLAWRGFFSVGPLSGLMGQPPQRYGIMENDPAIPGQVIVERVDTGNDEYSLIGINVEIDEETYHLFYLLGEEAPVEKIQQLWREGWFLSLWGLAYYRRTGHFSSFPLRRIPALLRAPRSKEGTEDAIRLLKRI